MLFISILLYAFAIFLTFKYVKSSILEIAILISITVICKFIVKDGSFYPLFAMPMLIALRYDKPYTIIYTLVIVTIVNVMYGFGIWSIGQYVIYGIISLGTYCLRNFLNKQNKLVVFGYSFASMFIFGVLMDVFSFYTGNFLGYPNVFIAIVGGLPFDLQYGISGIIYGGLSLAITYIASIDVKDILKIRKMTLVKSC